MILSLFANHVAGGDAVQARESVESKDFDRHSKRSRQSGPIGAIRSA
jgi:hypothetical protein